MSFVSRSFLLALAVLSSSTAMSARAQDNGFGYGYLYGFGGLGYAGYQAYVPTPPYFAIHPPVYYGQRYTRPYGVSPFAAWPQMQANPGYMPKPAAPHAQTVMNPYVPGVNPEPCPVAPAVVTKNVEPVVVENPYFKPEAAQFVKELPNQSTGTN